MKVKASVDADVDWSSDNVPLRKMKMKAKASVDTDVDFFCKNVPLEDEREIVLISFWLTWAQQKP